MNSADSYDWRVVEGSLAATALVAPVLALGEVNVRAVTGERLVPPGAPACCPGDVRFHTLNNDQGRASGGKASSLNPFPFRRCFLRLRG